MKPSVVKPSTYMTLLKNLMIKILNLKLVTLLEYQNIIFFAIKGYVPNWSEDIFVIKKVKNTVDICY